MNKHLHRIIFNRARGERMVVQETASSAGASGSGETRSAGARGLVHAAVGALALLQPLVHAQIIADPSAPANQRPVILNTANGLPLVNIQTPSAAGVSRNTFSQFDVQRGGAVLNNSRTNVQTQLGGFVQGNPYLATGSARVILNEINSSKPTQLRGYTEVAGQRAEVVIANPSGIQIDGAGFINTRRVTLTTGAPVMNGGSLDGYRVQRGSVAIQGAGLDNSGVDYTATRSRSGDITRFGLIGTTCDILGCDDKYGYITVPYVIDIPHTVTTGIAVTQGNAAVPATGTAPGPAAATSVNTSPGASGTVSAPARNAGIGQVAQTVPATDANGPAPVVRTVLPDVRMPGASLFHTNPNPAGSYLIETDPRFASYQNWLGSDYLLSALGLDPSQMQKRLGDGFYEQRLVREQTLQLTGQRFLGDYTDDDTQYRALMDAGVTFAQTWGLRPGIALSAAQMALLTSDIVWLVEQDVTLPDGSVQKVLVPQVYVLARQGDIDGAGTLLSGRSLDIQLSGDLTNTGTIGARQVVNISARNVDNLGGRISGRDVSITALNDLNNIGGSIDAGHSLFATAGHDLNITSTSTSGTGTTGTGQGGTSRSSYSGIDRVAGLYVTAPGGVLVASAGHDINITAGALQSQGSAYLQAGHDINLGTVSQGDSTDASRDSGNYLRLSQRQDIGSQLGAQDDLSLNAGHDINASAASINSKKGEVFVYGGNDLTIGAGQRESALSTGSQTRGSSAFNTGSTTVRSDASSTQAIGSSIGGNTVFIQAGHDLTVTGSNVVSDQGTVLTAKHDVTIQHAVNTSSQGSSSAHQESGLSLDGGVLIGSQAQSTRQQNQATTAAASTIGSIGGDVVIRAGNTYTQTGSDVRALDGDVDIKAKSVNITEARETTNSQSEQRSSQSGFSLSASNLVINAAQTSQGVLNAVGNTGDARLQAMGVASAGLNGYNTVGSLSTNGTFDAAKAGGISINASLGSSKSESHSSSQSDTARGSTVKGNNVSIVATGGGEDSNLLIQGSEVTASGKVTLKADNKVILRAAENSSEEHSSNSSSSGSIGVGMGFQNGRFTGPTINASASKGNGKSNGSDTWFSNTHVTGHEVDITSGGDMVMDGAVVTAYHAKADIGGNLVIGSRQDASNYSSEQKSSGASISVSASGMPTGGGISVGKSHIDSDFKSVSEQSGIKTGDGGFDVNVKGKTTLNGGVITTTAQGVSDRKNHFVSEGGIETTDIQNSAAYKGSGYAVSASIGSGLGPDEKEIYRPGGSAGVASVDGQASSTTQSGISGIAGNKDVTAYHAKADIGGNLVIGSRQDASNYSSEQKSSGASISVSPSGMPTGGGISVGKSHIDSDFKSVNEQSGIKTGDGGFDVNVKGKTFLDGGVITTTAQGVSDRKNHFVSEGGRNGRYPEFG